MQAIKDHVRGLPNVCKIKDLDNGGIGFILDDDYAVEIYEKDGELNLSYNGMFDHNGHPLMGCWEHETCTTYSEVIDVLANVENWD